MGFTTENSDRFFESITEKEKQEQVGYWSQDIGLPQSFDENFQRWLFAMVSPRTSWQLNVRGYEAIKDFYPWKWNRKELAKRLRLSGAGLHNERADNIWAFTRAYWEDPMEYLPKAGEHWWAYRDRIESRTRGIARAKTSFGLELNFPSTAKVLCADIHGCRLYGLDSTLNSSVKHAHLYDKMEYHWLNNCRQYEVPSVAARNIFWNRQLKRKNTRFWSRCLESSETQSRLDQIEMAESYKKNNPLFDWAGIN